MAGERECFEGVINSMPDFGHQTPGYALSYLRSLGSARFWPPCTRFCPFVWCQTELLNSSQNLLPNLPRTRNARFCPRSLGYTRFCPSPFFKEWATWVCVCVFSSHSFWTSSSLDVPAGVTQEEGHTGFLIHLLSAVRALIFLARRIQPFLSLVNREVELCVLTI